MENASPQPNEVAQRFRDLTGYEVVGVKSEGRWSDPDRVNVVLDFEDKRAGEFVSTQVSFMGHSEPDVIDKRIKDAADAFVKRVAIDGRDMVRAPKPALEPKPKAKKSRKKK